MSSPYSVSKSKKTDYFFLYTLVVIVISCLLSILNVQFPLDAINRFIQSVAALVSQMWMGVATALIAVAFISILPKDFIAHQLGNAKGLKGLAKATAAGVLFDLCSHGIVLVSMRLYKSGASLGQTMAFLIASPWNSLSLTIIMVTLFGFWWTLLFIILSALIAIGSGFIFDWLVENKHLPQNPAQPLTTANLTFSYNDLVKSLKAQPWSLQFVVHTFLSSWHDSKAILRWTFFGIILSGLLKGVMDADNFAYVFGPTIVGLTLTILGAALIEICSEGTIPIASDLMNVAQAPGNSFAFMMSGVSTDYSEIIAVKEGTGSWKIAFFLPLVTVPQIFLLGFLLNQL